MRILHLSLGKHDYHNPFAKWDAPQSRWRVLGYLWEVSVNYPTVKPRHRSPGGLNNQLAGHLHKSLVVSSKVRIWRFPEIEVPPNHPFQWHFPL